LELKKRLRLNSVKKKKKTEATLLIVDIEKNYRYATHTFVLLSNQGCFQRFSIGADGDSEQTGGKAAQVRSVPRQP